MSEPLPLFEPLPIELWIEAMIEQVASTFLAAALILGAVRAISWRAATTGTAKAWIRVRS